MDSIIDKVHLLNYQKYYKNQTFKKFSQTPKHNIKKIENSEFFSETVNDLRDRTKNFVHLHKLKQSENTELVRKSFVKSNGNQVLKAEVNRDRYSTNDQVEFQNFDGFLKSLMWNTDNN